MSRGVRRLAERARDGERLACLTAYDAGFAVLLEQAGVDLILVGDSLGMVIQGHDSTVPVTMEHMVYHTRLVSGVCLQAVVMADLPFLSFTHPAQALENAGRLVQEGGAQIVKLEGGAQQADIVASLGAAGIPVCAHLGLRPQYIHKLGGYRVQGREPKAAAAMLRDAATLAAAGADMLLLECVPSILAAEITAAAQVPVIGIGAGSACHGQILVLHDILGITPGRAPRFAHNFMTAADSVQGAVAAYVQAVRSGAFPAAEHGFE